MLKIKIIAILTTLLGQAAGEYPIHTQPYATMAECQQALVDDQTYQLVRLEAQANQEVDFSAAHIVVRGECVFDDHHRTAARAPTSIRRIGD